MSFLYSLHDDLTCRTDSSDSKKRRSFTNQLGETLYEPMILARTDGSAQTLGTVVAASGVGGVIASLVQAQGTPQHSISELEKQQPSFKFQSGYFNFLVLCVSRELRSKADC